MKTVRSSPPAPFPVGDLQSSKRFLGAVFALALAPAAAFSASTDLRITEVNPADSQVEVTHSGTEAFTTTAAMPFCHRFIYSTVIPAGTSFEPGESKVFTVVALSNSDSDIWLYREGTSNFGSSSQILSGMKFGPASSVGRMSVAVAAGIWPATDAFVPLPSSGESLQPVSFEATVTTNWISAPTTYGSFSPLEFKVLEVAISGDALELKFSSSFALESHQLQGRSSLSSGTDWTNRTATVEADGVGRFTVTLDQPASTEFFRMSAGDGP